ncbi:MAG TPA: tryptophan-rich sensory protein, partial [Herpetosiphonaceae bacterium]
MSRDTLRQGLVIAALAATIGVNGLANALPLNGQTTGDVANSFPTFFTPASYVFSIWGVIYLGLIGYAGLQALPSERANPRLQAIGGWFLLSCIANCLWLVLWHYEYFALTMLAMLTLLLS